MGILAWIVLGIIAGAIAKAIYPGHQGGGLLSTMVLGIIGAFIGGSIAHLLETGTLGIATASLSLTGVIVAVLGAMLAIFLYYKFSRRAY